MIPWLLQKTEKDPTTLFRKRDLLNQSPVEFERLKRDGFLIYVQTDPEKETFPCNLLCSRSCPRQIVEMQGQFYAICPEDAEINPILLSEDDLNKYAFSIQKLLEEIREANRLSGSLHVIAPDYSYLGYATHQDRRIGFLFGFTAATKDLLELSGLKRLCADDDFLVIFSPVSMIEDVSYKRELERERIVQTSCVSSLNFQTYEFSFEKLLSGTIAREVEKEQKTKPLKEPPKLNDAEQNIVEALNTATLTGEKLAEKAGYPYNSNFKSTLSSLRKRGIVGNKSPGYFVQPDYHSLIRKSE